MRPSRSTPRASKRRPAAANLHRVWHRIQPTIARYLSCPDQAAKLKLMAVMDRHMTRYPADVFHAGCDDDHFSTSSLYFILHRDGTRFMGTTVLFVSQCDTQVPSTFFLYPGHVASLQAALRECQRAYVGSEEWKLHRHVQRLIRRKRTP